jgi:hypothetical protein
MKPKPLDSLNHFTVPVAIYCISLKKREAPLGVEGQAWSV